MTIGSNDRHVRYTAAADQTVFDADFPVAAAADIEVWRDRAGAVSKLVQPTDYTVTNVGLTLNARITLVTGATLNDVIVLQGQRGEARSTDFIVDGDFRADDVDAEFDRIYIHTQELQRDVDRSLRRRPTAPVGAFEAENAPIQSVGHIQLADRAASIPAVPPTGYGQLLAKTVSGVLKLFWRRPDSTEVDISGSADQAAAAAASASNAAGSATTASTAATAAASSLSTILNALAAAMIPSSLTGKALKVLRVKADETGYEHADVGGDVVAVAQFGAANQLIRAGGANKTVKSGPPTLSDTGDIDGLGFLQFNAISSPSNPATNKLRAFMKNGSNKLYTLDSAGVETVLGGTGGPALQPENIGLSVSAAAGALVINLTCADGSAPSVSNPVVVPFRSTSGPTGTIITQNITGPTTLTVSAGSTLGVPSSTAFRLWVLCFNDGGTLRIGVVNCLSHANGVVNAILSLADNLIASSTAEGGAGGADSAQIIYTSTAVTSKPYRILGYIEWAAAGVTAGTWTTTNFSIVQPYHVGIPTPGMPTGRRARVNKTDVFTSSTATTWTDITNYSASITPTSAANAVRAAFNAYCAVGAGNGVGLRLVRGSTGIALGDADSLRTQVSGFLNRSTDLNSASVISNETIDLPQATSSTTYKVQFFLQADTLYFNRSAASNDNNVVFRAMSYLQLEEIMT